METIRMRRIIVAAAVGSVALAFAFPAFAASPIDGTWKAEVSSAKLSTKPDVWTIKDGVYSCTSCTPPYKIAADGKTQAVAGRDYWDAAAVMVIDANNVSMTRYRAGSEVGSTKVSLSSDGQMLTWVSTSSDNAKGTPITNTSMSKRVGAAPAGAHAASGSWQAVNEGAQIAEENLIATMSMTGKVVKFALATGEHYTATIGGPKVPFVGDKAGAMVAVTAAGKGFTETDYVKGKAIGTYTYVPVDAKTMTFKAVNLKSNTTDEYTLKKQ
jgi:hypothetical protein